jgi:predicted nucleotidyltransferase
MVSEPVMISEQVSGQLISQQTIDGIVATITSAFKPSKILLFGSYANGQATPDSDLDLSPVDVMHQKSSCLEP